MTDQLAQGLFRMEPRPSVCSDAGSDRHGSCVPGPSERSVATAGWCERVAGGEATTAQPRCPAHSGLRLEGRRGTKSGLTFKTSAWQREGTDWGGRDWGREEQEEGGLGWAGAGVPSGGPRALCRAAAAGGSQGAAWRNRRACPGIHGPGGCRPTRVGAGEMRAQEAAGAGEAGTRPRLSQP